MSARQTGWIGIDFGVRAVKLAQVERVGHDVRLAAAMVVRGGESATSSAARPAEVSWWDDLVGTPLRRGFAGRRAACVLPASLTDLRAMSLPEGSVAERRAMIATELASLLGDSAGRRVFDFWDTRPHDEAGDSNLENVNVLSIAEDEAEAAARRLGRAGLRCEAIDGLPTALARAVAMVLPPDGLEPVAAIDWGYQSATLCVIHRRRAAFTRQLRNCGFAALPAAVSAALGLSADDAEHLLATYGVSDPAGSDDPLREVQDVLTDIVAAPLAEIVSELNKTLAYPELHRSRLVPQMLWLFGGGATVRNMAAHLSPKTGLPVRVWG
ncbi:MAG: hypothetical protein NUV77_03210, partial [Thermoguttaceae bacterium]|nr:hypothetical protein [Thermoguttaceae bacterium]